MSESPIRSGEKAPDFVLKDQNKNEFRLYDHVGRRILLSFHPLAWTPVCAKQMKALDRSHDAFAHLNTFAVGLSVDSLPCKYAWAKELNITRTSLLSDFWPHGGVAESLGIFRKKEGFSERANIILSPDMVVEWIKIYPIPELPDLDEVLKNLKRG
jgi:peroxiredoxin